MAATSKLFLLLLPIICFYTCIHLAAAFGVDAPPTLHSQELKALRIIAKKLKKTDREFSLDPCSRKGNWSVLVTCDCPYNHDSTCHMITISLKAQNLSGIVPPEFSELRYLKELDLSHNFLTGTVPPQWATMRLVDLFLMGNQLSGQFPMVLTSITTLRTLSIEGNRFDGVLPPEIGKLVNLEIFVLSPNAFTGKLPQEFVKLISLIDLRMSNNNFTGKIPGFIGEWINIQKLHIQGCSLLGPIPSSISFLTRLNDLVLSSCLLSGEIPSYIGKMEELKHLDLGFNSLTGEIPPSFANLTKLDFMSLTRNELTGYAPLWILERIKNVDISCNNFTWDRSSQPECPRGRAVHPCKKPNDRKKVIIAAGTVAAAVFLTLVILCIMRRTGYLRCLVSAEKELRGLDLHTGHFTLRQIKAATNNFDLANKIGEGGFGSVYKGLLSDGTVIAVKQLSSKSKQGGREFVNEIGMISALQHPNLVKLYGCCVEGNHMMIIYEYMENNCLSRALFRKDPTCKLRLDWPARRNICLGVARGLAYLHEASRIRIVHRDIKTSNVLLDKYLNAKISDFGLAKLNEDDNTHISTRVAGTIGYMAPEYAMRGHLTSKADVYSFGVVGLETVSGKSNTNFKPTEEFVCLLEWANVLQERGCLLELVDPELGSDYSSEEAMVMLNVAILCTNASSTLRPTMSQVVSMLEGRTQVQDLLSDLSAINKEKSKAIRSHFWQQSPSQTHRISINGPCTDTSGSYIEAEDSGRLFESLHKLSQYRHIRFMHGSRRLALSMPKAYKISL